MDMFAQIAHSGIRGRREQLVQPVPNDPKAQVCTLQPCSGLPTRTPQRSQTAEELANELTQARTWAAKFLRHLAPPVTSKRRRVELREFLYTAPGSTKAQSVTIPHYGGPLGKATACYETTFTHEAPEPGQGVFLQVNGADYLSRVFVNGHFIGSHEGFFAQFELDITQAVQEGPNCLRLEIDNDYVMIGNSDGECGARKYGDKIYAATGPGYDDPEVGWHHCPPGMGLLDTIVVEVRQDLFIQDVVARPLPEERVEFWFEIGNRQYTYRDPKLRVSVYGLNCEATLLASHIIVPGTQKELGFGDTLTEVEARRNGTTNEKLSLPCGKGRNLYKEVFHFPSIRSWTPEEPWLYEVQVELLDEENQVLDTFKRTFGYRLFTQKEYRGRKGMFFLNGQPTRLRGANTMGFEQQDVMHGDLDQLVDDILLAKLCNMNFLRITQRPVQQQIYDICDHLGMMVQTDFPLFGCLRRQQLCEAIRQVEEMARHVRAHPCCVLFTYINEPFPNANNLPSMNLDRQELESFFRAADIVVRINAPDAVIKHIDGDYDPPSASMPDNHCYSMWYNGHGIDIGMLHKGYWLPVAPGWYYGCGEFGCEGLEDLELMEARYPIAWLPQNRQDVSWDPDRIPGAQTGSFYHFFYERPENPAAWVEKSQQYQALATKMMTEAFRRDEKMASFALHLFIDAFPSGWMKTIMDCRRVPKQAYFAYRDALAPMLVSLRTDRTVFFGGELVQVEGWICNDTPCEHRAVMHYELLDGNSVIMAGDLPAKLTANNALLHSLAEFTLPCTAQRRQLQLRGLLLHEEKVLAFGTQKLTVLPQPEQPLPSLLHRPISRVSRADLDKVRNGALLWVEAEKPGQYHLGDISVQVKESAMCPFHFAARAKHPWTQKLHEEDMRHWYSSEAGRIVPLADCSIKSEALRPVLYTRNLDEEGHWKPESLLCEKQLGMGRVIISTISYQRMIENPAGRMLLEAIQENENEE